MRRGKLVIIIILLILAIGAAALWLLKSTTPPKASTEEKTSYPVEIGNLETSGLQLSETRMTMIKSYVSSAVTAKHGEEGVYQATYRQKSYKRLVTPQGTIVNTVLVDVASTKETYLVTWTGGENDSHGTSYIRCAPEADQFVHPSVCKELADD